MQHHETCAIINNTPITFCRDGTNEHMGYSQHGSESPRVFAAASKNRKRTFPEPITTGAQFFKARPSAGPSYPEEVVVVESLVAAMSDWECWSSRWKNTAFYRMDE